MATTHQNIIAALLLLHVCSAGLSNIFVTVYRRVIVYKHYAVIYVAERLSNTFVAATVGLLHRQALCMLQQCMFVTTVHVCYNTLLQFMAGLLTYFASS